jgi:uroporphyrin-III C-methyltransferase
MAATGTVYLVGAGPGAPDLLTLRAAELLRRADIVFYDALVHPDTLALAGKAEKIAVGKRCGRHSAAQRFINKRLVDAARSHAVVVRLKGGDPLLFGRAQEEIDALEQHGVEYRIVPGITAALAASAAVGVSMTCRGLSRNVAFITPRTGAGEQGHDWARSALASDTCAIYMGVGEAAQIAATLMARGASPDRPAVIVESATWSAERRIAVRLADLGAAAAQTITGPAVILLGEVYARIASVEVVADPPARSRAA